MTEKSLGWIRRLRWTLVLIILIPICAVNATRIVNGMDYHHKDNDFFTFWLAGHLSVQGGDPYDPSQWKDGYQQYDMKVVPNPAFLYPLPMALLFSVLGILPFHAAAITWITLLQVLIFFSLVIFVNLEKNRDDWRFFIPLLAGTLLFRPTALTLSQGQVSGLFLILIACMAWLWNRGKWFSGGVLLGMLLLKPNLGLIIVALLVPWLIFNKRWKGLFGGLFSGILLFTVGALVNNGWLLDYFAVGSNKLGQVFGGSPTVFGLSALVCHNHSNCSVILGLTGTFLLLAVSFLFLIRSNAIHRPAIVLPLVVTLTLLITPYTWTYDQLLLLFPIAGLTFAMHRAGCRFSIAASLLILLDLLTLLLVFPDSLLGVEILNVFLPMVIWGLCLWWIQSRTYGKDLNPEFRF